MGVSVTGHIMQFHIPGLIFDRKGTIWLGYYFDSQRELKSIDGTAVTFAPWAKKEPNNRGKKEYCVQMLGRKWDYKWNDFRCGYEPEMVKQPRSFVCKSLFFGKL